jgi:uncharacterized protein (TIGR02996 family)
MEEFTPTKNDIELMEEFVLKNPTDRTARLALADLLQDAGRLDYEKALRGLTESMWIFENAASPLEQWVVKNYALLQFAKRFILYHKSLPLPMTTIPPDQVNSSIGLFGCGYYDPLPHMLPPSAIIHSVGEYDPPIENHDVQPSNENLVQEHPGTTPGEAVDNSIDGPRGDRG